MLDNNPADEFSNLSNEVNKVTEAFDKLISKVSSFSVGRGTMTSVLGGQGTGQLDLGFGNVSMMPTSLANMSVNQILASSRAANLKYSGLMGATQAVTGATAGIGMMMPNVMQTTARSAGFYNAAIMAGGSMSALGSRTLGLMGGGLTETGGDALVANALIGAGVNPYATGPSRGQFDMLAMSTRNAARYLNINNQQAAQSLAGLTSGGTSRSIMQNFGVFTTDPTTGRRRAPTEIIGDIANRMTMGNLKNLSREDILTSLQGGALSANLEASGLDATQQQLVAQYMLSGGKMKLEDQASMEAAFGANTNPLASGMDINTAQTKSMQTAMEPYIKGLQDAAAVITTLNDAVQPLISTFGQLNATVQTLAASNIIQGAGTAVGSLAMGANTYSKASRTNRGLKNTADKSGVTKSGGVKASPMRGKGAGIAGAIAMLAAPAAGQAVSAITDSNNWGNAASGAMSYGATGAMIGTLINPGLGTAIGAGVGAVAGGVAGFFGLGGGVSIIGGGTTTDTSNGAFKLVHPTGGQGSVTTKYGQTDSVHKTPHKGIDFGVRAGTPVQAGAAGRVTHASGTTSNTYGSGNKSLGLQVWIDHGNGYVTMYGHLSSVGVSVGTTVTAGQVIAKSGNSGYSTGDHLHFQLEKDGRDINPAPFLGGISAMTGGTYSEVTGNAGAASNSIDVSTGVAGSAGTLGLNTGIGNTGVGTLPRAYSGTSASAAIGNVIGQTAGGGALLGQASTSVAGAASMGVGVGGGEPASSGGNTVTINLSIAEASEDEARKFAQLVKNYLEQDTLTNNMGRL